MKTYKTLLACLACTWILAAKPGWTVPLIDPSFNDAANFATNWNPSLGSPSFNSLSLGAPGNNAGAVDPGQTSAQFGISSGLADSTSLRILQTVALTSFHNYQLQYWTSNQIASPTGSFGFLGGSTDTMVLDVLSLVAADSGFVMHTFNFSTALDPNWSLLFILASPNPSQNLSVWLDDISLTDLGAVAAPEINGSAALLPFLFTWVGLALIKDRRSYPYRQPLSHHTSE